MKKILLGFIAIGLLTFAGQLTLMSCDVSNSELKKLEKAENKRKVYESVKIGAQNWMSENLNVEHFRNGDVIPEVKINEDWRVANEKNQPAWCYYDNDISNGEKYGKLYNWHAVNDSRGLAPKGWRIPTDEEWTELTDYLSANGHDGTEGTALKATSGWNSGGNGTDDYGFLGLPGGSRDYYGGFHFIGNYGYWWSSSQNGASSAWYRDLDYASDSVNRDNFDKRSGFSVRCLRD